MRLTITNLGPIEHGQLDLDKHLVILTGPNNTGKSYLTYLIHGISQCEALLGYNSLRLSIIDILRESSTINTAIANNQPIEIRKVISEAATHLSKLAEDIISDNIKKIFLSKSIDGEVRINLGDFTTTLKPASMEFINIDGDDLHVTTADGILHKNFFDSALDLTTPTPIEERIYRVISVIVIFQFNLVVRRRTYFFPAERTAINLFAKHIVSTKAEIKDDFDADSLFTASDEEFGRRVRAQIKAAPKYPYAIRDYINFVNTFDLGEPGEFASIADSIESNLAGGTIHLDDSEQLLFTPENSSIPLELHLASSLVKSLSYLTLYLRYKAKSGDHVIIDEPEINLHPNLQVAVAKTIAEMVNAGLRVTISTHSDYLIKELNNLILLSKLPESKENTLFLSENNYKSTHFIDNKEVAGYFLDKNSINLIDIEENGIEVPSINDAMISIDSMAQEIFFRLEE